MAFFTAPLGVIVLQSQDLQAWVLPYGARLMQLWWMTAPEGPRPLTLGFKNPDDYRQDTSSIGAVCGRYGNRIGQGQLARDGQQWALDINNSKGHCLHGGREGSGQLDWTVQSLDANAVSLTLDTPGGHMGFPGRCKAQVTYALQGARLVWQAQAEVDAPCPLNFVQHSYWNLDAQAGLQHHLLQVNAQAYLPTDALDLPMPAQSVQGTCFDFRQAAGFPATQIQQFDVAVQLDAERQLRRVARLSGRDLSLTLSTDRPWMHVYAAGNLKPGSTPLGAAHLPGAALCLETEDMPNGPALGAPVWYAPGEKYFHAMTFDFAPGAQ